MNTSRVSSPFGQVSSIKNQINNSLAIFRSVLSSDRVSGLIEKYFSDYRDRAFSPSVTLGVWVGQNLAADKTCAAAVDRVNAERISNGLSPLSSNTGAYCTARERIHENFVRELLLQEGAQLESGVPTQWMWKGKLVKLTDGMTTTLCDTAEIKSEFPLSESQQASNSLPLARIVGLFSLASGGLVDLAIGPYCGKETGESALLRQLIPTLNSGEVLMGDGIYPSFFCLATLKSRGIGGVFAAGTRHVDFRGGQRLGKKDHIVEWEKPQRPSWMSEEEYKQFPNLIRVREVETYVERPGFRTEHKTLFTTILSQKEASQEELSLLFSRRWEIELHFRSIKSELQMDFISTRTPEMVRKDIYITLLGYNLIRKIMSEAALLSGCLPTQISFKRTVQIFESYKKLWEVGKINSALVYDQILMTIAKLKVGKRPNRSEPRKVRRTKDRFPKLKTARIKANTANS